MKCEKHDCPNVGNVLKQIMYGSPNCTSILTSSQSHYVYNIWGLSHFYNRQKKPREQLAIMTLKTVNVHLYTLKNIQQNECNRGDFCCLLAFK